MEKLDLVKKYSSYYTAKAYPELVQFNEVVFLSIEGKGDPSSEEFAVRVQALYSVAYALKFKLKAKGKDFTVAKLEGQWWVDKGKYSGLSWTEVPRSEWYYRLLIRMPEFIEKQALEGAIIELANKKKVSNVEDVSLFTLDEGKAVQMMHTGPFNKESETIEKIIDFMNNNGLKPAGLHHEIYLSDFRRTAPEKLKTILREPAS